MPRPTNEERANPRKRTTGTSTVRLNRESHAKSSWMRNEDETLTSLSKVAERGIDLLFAVTRKRKNRGALTDREFVKYAPPPTE